MGPNHRLIGVLVAAGLACSLLAGSAAAPAVVSAQTSPPPSSPSSSPSSCEFDGVERIVAIGDVHGAYQRLVDILRTSGLVDARLRWTGQKAHLIQIGDVVDRGPDSRKVLDLYRKLEGEAERAGGAVHLLLGNHEVMRMMGDMRYVDRGEYEAFRTPDSFEIRESFVQTAAPAIRADLLRQTPLGYVEMRLAFGRQGIYGQWLRQHDVMIKVNGILFVHGGIAPALAGISCQELNTTIRREIGPDLEKTLADPLSTLSGREDGQIWYRGLAEEPESFAPEVDTILARQRARAIVMAHTVMADARIRVRFAGRVYLVDTGMQPVYVPRGRASALDIQGGVFTAIYQDRRDVLRAAPASVPSTPRAAAPR